MANSQPARYTHDIDRLRRQARRLARRDPRHRAIAAALDWLAQRRPSRHTPRHPGGRHVH